ncbi:MAG: hypothetical protein RDV41_15180, partial [Planctomycetota bacterium]|nr:hypothetical protein [Planctomycetota bacterium]
MQLSTVIKSPLLVGAIRFLGVILVIYAFAVVLMVGAAQQQVSAALVSIKSDVGYSAAHAKILDLEQLRREIDDLIVEERTRVQEQREAEFKYQELVSDSDVAWSEVDAALQPLIDRDLCTFSPGKDQMALWHASRRCLALESLSVADGMALHAALNRSPSAEALHQRKLAQGRIADRAYNQLQATRTSIAAAREKVRQGQALRSAFEEMRVLRRGWLPGASLLVYFPPTLVQILLAFTSGLFGALLITLVLAVYPKSTVKFTGGEG